MCGICGIAGAPTTKSNVLEMVSKLVHRGPDDQGVFVAEQIGLGHARLSILDLTSAGHQPMSSLDGRFTICFNGEIYNFREIRTELESLGYKFNSNSDTEVILAAFQQWQTDSFDRLDGMFALAIWDKQEHSLILARDRFGIKPLYYSWSNGKLLFASEPKSILAVSCQDSLDWTGLHEYLHYGSTLGESTLFSGIKRLLPGYQLLFNVKTGKASQQAFADLASIEPVNLPYEEAIATLREKLEAAVQAHLVSDVPIGVFLSGGIDSACVTAFAAKHYSGQLSTYSAAFDFDGGHDELEYASIVAKRFNCNHHELFIKAENIADDIEELAVSHDVPFGDAANLPLYLICRQLNGEPKVILQGDGGDELFGGYHRYARLQRIGWFKMIAPILLGARSVLPKNSSAFRSLRTIDALANAPDDERMARLMSQEPLDSFPETVFSSMARKQLLKTDPFARYRQLFKKYQNLDPVRQMQFTDCSIILPDKYFEKVDRATMAHSIEVRVPFMDLDLVSFGLGLPAKYKVHKGQKKRILRDALRNVIPDKILDGKKKGFGVPVSEWLRGPLSEFMKSVLLDPTTEYSGLFDQQEIENRIRAHIDRKADYGMILYKLLVLAIWLRKYKPSINDGANS